MSSEVTCQREEAVAHPVLHLLRHAQEAADLATRCLTRAIEKGASRKAAVRISASVLTKAAIDRGSKDNVTVVMVDLKVKGPEDEPGSKSTSGPEAPGGAVP